MQGRWAVGAAAIAVPVVAGCVNGVVPAPLPTCNPLNTKIIACPPAVQTLRFREILAGKLRHVGAEASTHYGRNGQLIAGGLHNVRMVARRGAAEAARQ